MGLCKCLCEAGEVRASARKVKQVGDTDLCPQRSGGHQWALGRESRDCICSLCGLNTCELNDEYLSCRLGFPGGASGKEPACQCRRHKRWEFLGQKDPLEEGMATLSSILAWRIPQTEEPGGLQSMGSQKVTHD